MQDLSPLVCQWWSNGPVCVSVLSYRSNPNPNLYMQPSLKSGLFETLLGPSYRFVWFVDALQESFIQAYYKTFTPNLEVEQFFTFE